MLSTKILTLAKILWDYHLLHHKLEKSDCILALGSSDTRVAMRAAELYFQGWAPLILFSGGLGKNTEGVWKDTEAVTFAKIAIDMGVPEHAILIENKSTNTGDNILFSKQLLQEKHLHPESFILVQKPYMERRSYAAFKKRWPEKKVIVTSPKIPFEDYPTNEIPMELAINVMVGDLQRIKVYVEKGYQIFQEIPDEVWEAYEKLVELGFDQFVIRE